MRWLVVLLVGACAVPENVPPIDIDVVVSSSSVVVYPQNDLNCTLGGSADRVFPALGECVNIFDATVFNCPAEVRLASCFTEVSVDGVIAHIATYTDYARPFAIATPVGADSVLTLRGCGLDAEIPISATDLPVLTLTGEIDADMHVTGAWTTTTSYDSTLVTLIAGNGGRVCRVGGDSYTFELPGVAGQARITAQPLLPAETHLEDTATIRVWRGEQAELRL